MERISEFMQSMLMDAQQQAKAIDDETMAEAAKLNAETDMLLAKERERIYVQHKRMQEELLQKAEAKRRLEATQLVLAKKQQLLDETFAAARQELDRLPLQRRRKLLSLLLKRTQQQMDVGTIIAKKDAAIFRGLRVKDGSDSGFIAVSKDGKVRIDMRFDTLLEDIKMRKTPEIAAILFGEKKEAS